MFPLTITTVDKVLFKDETFSVNCPGVDGEMTVLAHHAPLITTLKKGVIRVRRNKDAEEEVFPIERGLLEVGVSGVTILL